MTASRGEVWLRGTADLHAVRSPRVLTVTVMCWGSVSTFCFRFAFVASRRNTVADLIQFVPGFWKTTTVQDRNIL